MPSFPEFCVRTTRCHEFIMGAEFANETVFDHGDSVGVVCGVEAVGDSNNGASGKNC